jgi:hypothetical protein
MNVPGRWIPVPALALALIFGCSKAEDAEDLEAGNDTPALNTNIEIAKADVPARYAAALPATDAALQHWLEDGDDSLPPFPHVRDLLMSGQPKMLERVAAAAKSVPAAEGESWARRVDNALQYEVAAPMLCESLQSVMQAPASTLRRALVGVYAGHCATDDEVALVMRADTPDSAVLNYYGSYYLPDDHPRPYHARYGAAARTAIIDAEYADRRTAFVLAHHPDPRARAALRRIHAEIRDPERADQVAYAFHDAKDPKDKALATAACERHPKDPICDTSSRIRNPDGSPYVMGEPAPEPPAPSPAAIKATIDKLAAAGFSKVSTVDPATAETDAPDQLLMIAGYTYWFDVETGMYPNNHDSLMRQLSALAAPELDGAIFEEVAPGVDDESGPYRLTVYTAGKRLRAEARNFGDWYDAEAVINLMNAVAKENGSKIRFVAMSGDGQTMAILAAPAGAIARGIQNGLIEIGGGGEAMEAGKSFEDKVMEAFKN